MKAVGTLALGVLIVAGGCAERPGPPSNVRARASGGAVGETVSIAADQPIPNAPGKRLITRVVDYAPGGRSVSHRHARSAFIHAYVVSGKIRSQVNDEPVRIYNAGEWWFEKPGSHHRVSENASDTEPARLLAVFIVDEGDTELTVPDSK